MTDTEFNPDDFRAPVDVDLAALLSAKKRPPRHKGKEKFLKGPIPWDWLVQAMQLPGSALQVGLVLWFQSGISRNRAVKFNQASATRYGMHGDTAKRGIRALEAAGLVQVLRLPGHALEVTLLDAPNAGAPSTD